MRIVSWNIERPRKDKKWEKNLFIMELIKGLNPDIIFLTETNSIIDFSSDYFTLQTTPLPEKHENNIYYKGENRVSIFSKYEFISKSETYDSYTSVCGEVATPFGNLILYGSIIGSFGGKDQYFKEDLVKQKEEIRKLSQQESVCYSGDFNISFSGYPYPSLAARLEMNDFFKETHLVNTTAQNENCVIHIVLSENFVNGLEVKSQMIKIERAISDHNLVITDIDKQQVHK
jgi:endonuclease/exonuclease/phosphatase family metal-dependent hydrolase